MSEETFQDVYIGQNDVQTMILTLTHNSFRENAPLVYLHLKLFLLKTLIFQKYSTKVRKTFSIPPFEIIFAKIP